MHRWQTTGMVTLSLSVWDSAHDEWSAELALLETICMNIDCV
jgi:hypothetical protein